MKNKFKYPVIFLVAVAALLFGASFIKSDPAHEMRSEAESLQKSLQKREAILDRYCDAVLSGKSELRDEANLPEDMVIYHYKGDVAFTAPLAYLTSDQTYANLGTSWYYIKRYIQDNDRLIAAILIKNEYPQESLRSANRINPNLNLDGKYTTAPLSSGSAAIVHSTSGKPLFTVVETSGSHYSYGYYPLHWTVIFLLVVAAFFMHLGLRTRRSFILYAVAITLLAFWARRLAHICDPSGPFFSPLTYAGNNLLDSLASLLTVNSYLFLIAMGLFIMRAQLLDLYRHLNKGGRIACALASVAVAVGLALYINFALRSLIYNSNLSLNLANITRINIYSILCLVSFGLLFLALLHALQMCLTTIRGKREPNLYSWKFLTAYIALVALYTDAAEDDRVGYKGRSDHRSDEFLPQWRRRHHPQPYPGALPVPQFLFALQSVRDKLRRRHGTYHRPQHASGGLLQFLFRRTGQIRGSAGSRLQFFLYEQLQRKNLLSGSIHLRELRHDAVHQSVSGNLIPSGLRQGNKYDRHTAQAVR